MKYAVFTVAMGEYTVEDAASELGRMGYHGVEWRIHDDYHIALDEIEEKAEQIKALSDANDLEIASLGTYLDYHDIAGIKSALAAAKVMDCPAIRIGTPQYRGEAHYGELLEEAVTSLRQVEQLSADADARALLEIHSGTICPSASAAYRLLSNFDSAHLGVIFDPANMIIEGRENWKMGLEILGEYVVHVHAKNIAWFADENEGGRGWQWRYTPLDDGMVDWQEVMAALKGAGYDGYVSVEDLYGSELDTAGLLAESLAQEAGPGVATAEKLEKDLNYLRGMDNRVN